MGLGLGLGLRLGLVFWVHLGLGLVLGIVFSFHLGLGVGLGFGLGLVPDLNLNASPFVFSSLQTLWCPLLLFFICKSNFYHHFYIHIFNLNRSCANMATAE